VTTIDFVFSLPTGCTVEDLTGGSPRKMMRLDLQATPIPQLDGNNDSEKESDEQEEDQVTMLLHNVKQYNVNVT
jgi:hypothetical protein